MTIQISGIDTSNNDVVWTYANTTLQNFPNFQQIETNIIDSLTVQFVLSN